MGYGAWTATFDPSDIELLFVQDEAGQEYGAQPSFPHNTEIVFLSPSLVTHRPTTPRFEMGDDELGPFITSLRNAVLLPLSDEYLVWMGELLVGAENEARIRLQRRETAARRRREYGPSDWEKADLVAEVEAVAGQGRKTGGAYWLHDDRSPSLEVSAEKRVWHCFSCGKAGGVVDWRKAIA